MSRSLGFGKNQVCVGEGRPSRIPDEDPELIQLGEHVTGGVCLSSGILAQYSPHLCREAASGRSCVHGLWSHKDRGRHLGLPFYGDLDLSECQRLIYNTRVLTSKLAQRGANAVC